MTDSEEVVSVLVSLAHREFLLESSGERVSGLTTLQICLDAILSAYHEGNDVIQKLKAQAAEQRASPPPRVLEETIDQAPEEIGREKDRGVTRFGKAFEEGDHIAVIALQQITIQLQGTLLEKLKEAAFDQETDVSELVDAADLGRDRTIGALLELRQRLLSAPPSAEAESSTSSPIPSDGNGDKRQQQDSGVKDSLPLLKSSEENLAQAKTQDGASTRDSSARRSTEDDHSASTSEKTSSSGGRHRHGSILGFLKGVRQRSNSSKPQTDEVDAAPVSTPTEVPFHPPQQCDVREPEAGTSSSDNDNPRFTFEEGEDEWQRPAMSSQNSSRSAKRGSTQLSPDQIDTPPDPSRVNSSSTLSNASSRTLQPHWTANPLQSASTLVIHTPTPENEYLGLCKGAWKLQNGDRKAMQKGKEFNDGWSQTPVFCLMCSAGKCAFAGHVPIDIIWSKVWTVEKLGLQLRWAFLAKSHVLQQKVKDGKFRYQCLFCTLLHEDPPQFQGTDPYLLHLSKEHRGRAVNDVLLYKTGCVADHVCEKSEEFDINFYPLTTAEQADLDLRLRDEQIAAGEATSAARRDSSSDMQDSMFSEAWNEGLSEFHYDDEIEATEKEI